MTAARRLAAGSAALLMLLSGCTVGAPGGGSPPGATPPARLTEAAAETSIALPRPGGRGSLAPAVPAGSQPTKRPAQVEPALAKRALPTNQWWTSALTGPETQPIWGQPVAARVTGGRVQVSAAAPAASANSIVTPFVPALTVAGPVTAVRVADYGAFSVVLRARLSGGGSVDVTLVQGSPVLYLRFSGATPSLSGAAGATVTAAGDRARVEVAGQRWDALTNGGRWTVAGGRLTTAGSASGLVALARVPDGEDPAGWEAALRGAAGDPVVRTTAEMAYDPTSGTVTQTLSATRRSGAPGLWALLPHQRDGLVPGPEALKGSYQSARGALSLVRAASVRVRVPMPGLLPGVPSVPLARDARAAVEADLDRDLADKPGTGGSYFGMKELGRLATIAEVAGAVGASGPRKAALDRLRPQLVDWLTYDGPRDGRYFAYDGTWGGLIAVPPEFGSSDYNDHHFHYGYLVRAAAVLAQADPAFLRDYGPTVDLVVRDYAGALSAGSGAGFPAFRSFNAYLGHSAASGFAPFADGNNQESSSEAVAAWEAATRWGIVRGDEDLTAYGVTHYAMEAATARAYWLGETVDRPAGYAHTGAGIVWDAKIDYATFFDPRPESVQGIQLLPLTFGSLYRADARGAAARASELSEAVGGPPRIWGDLFAADLAVADPTAARERLTATLPREESTSRAMVRYWIEVLAELGPPQSGAVAGGPYGLAFGSAGSPTLVAVNPTGSPRSVTFRDGGDELAELEVGPGQSVSRTP